MSHVQTNEVFRRSALWQGRCLVVIAALLWSTSGFFAKSPLLDVWPLEIRGGVIAFWRAVFALLLLLPMVRRPRLTFPMLVLVLFFAAMNWTFLTALVGGPPENAIWLQYLSPVWVMLAGAFLLSEIPSRKDCGMLVLCSLGVGLILTMQLGYGGDQGAWWAVMLAVLSGVLYAGVVICLRLLRTEDSAWLIALCHIGTAVCMSPIALTANSLPQGSTWILLFCFGIFQIGLPYLLFARALGMIPVHEASLITLIEPVALPFWVFLAWGNAIGYEIPKWWTWIGGGLILGGLIVRFLGGSQRLYNARE